MKKLFACLKCLLFGCNWQNETAITMGGERLKFKKCQRCGAHKYQSWG